MDSVTALIFSDFCALGVCSGCYSSTKVMITERLYSGWLREAPHGQRHLGRAESFSEERDALAGKVIKLTGFGSRLIQVRSLLEASGDIQAALVNMCNSMLQGLGTLLETSGTLWDDLVAFWRLPGAFRPLW